MADSGLVVESKHRDVLCPLHNIESFCSDVQSVMCVVRVQSQQSRARAHML